MSWHLLPKTWCQKLIHKPVKKKQKKQKKKRSLEKMYELFWKTFENILQKSKPFSM